MGNFIKLMLYAGAEPNEFKKCELEMRRANQKRLMFYLTIACVFLVVMTGLACVNENFSQNFLVYSLPFVACLALLITTASFPNSTGKLLTLYIFLFMATLYIMAIVLGTTHSKNAPATTFIVFMVLLPLLFTMRPIRNILYISLFDGLYLFSAYEVKDISVARIDILNGAVFGVVSAIVSTYMMTVLVDNAIVRSKLFTASETDLNTSLRNRNAYENHMQDYPLRCSTTLCCVYVDVNGLHELNNTKGHAEGDKMLQIVADKLQAEFGEDTYRVGGDEFVAFVLDESHEDTQKRIAHFCMAVEMEGYSVAVGAATLSAGGIDINFLVKTAEQRMYMAKEEYYRKNSGEVRNYKEMDELEDIPNG